MRRWSDHLWTLLLRLLRVLRVLRVLLLLLLRLRRHHVSGRRRRLVQVGRHLLRLRCHLLLLLLLLGHHLLYHRRVTTLHRYGRTHVILRHYRATSYSVLVLLLWWW